MFLLSSCSPISNYSNQDDDVAVSVKEDETFTVLSKNPQTIKRGSDVSFRLKFVDDYTFESASNGTFENNQLIIKEVMFSQTITVSTVQLITVFLETDTNSHFSITSTNPINIKKGQDAVFDVELESGYKFENSDKYRYENGKLIFSNIKETCNVSALTVLGSMFKINITNNDSLGTVIVNPVRDYYDDGDVVNISVVPYSNNRFICISKDKDIHTLNDSAKPFTFKQSFDLTVTRDINLVVNYHNDNDYLMEYDANGGLTFEEQESLLFDYKLNGLRIRPNSLVNDSYFYRNGYHLESYNTKQDGSGTRIGIGSRIDVELFSNKTIKLYCQWIKETDESLFEVASLEGGVQISKYLGDESVVVIPNSIGDKHVLSIAKDSFVNKSVEKVYFPISLVEIKEDAFVNCGSLNSICYWTSLESISDNCFVKCNNLSAIAINCSTYPKYLNSFARGNYADKLDHAELLANNGPAMLAVGSSTLQYNHSFATMEDVLDNDFNCYNLACLFAMPLQLMYDFALTLAGADDLILIQLHETQASRKNPINSAVFAYLEGDMDRFLMINYQNHKHYFLSSWAKYKTDTSTMSDQVSYEYFDRGLKENGDYVWSSDEEKITEDNKGSGTLTISDTYTYDNFKYLTELHGYHGGKTTLLTFDTYNQNAIEDMTSFYNFETLIKTHFSDKFTIISNMDDSIIEGKYFRYQDNIHLNSIGGQIHCSFIAKKIKEILSF